MASMMQHTEHVRVEALYLHRQIVDHLIPEIDEISEPIYLPLQTATGASAQG